MTNEAEDAQTELLKKSRSKNARESLIWGFFSGWVFIFLPYFLVLLIQGKIGHLWDINTHEWVYNFSLLALMPLLQSFVAGLVRGQMKQSAWSGAGILMTILIGDLIAGALFMSEGVICLIMAFPILLIILAIGYGIGRAVARWRKSKRVSVSLAPLAVLLVIGETAGPAPNYADVITDSITVNAPAEYVWKYVVDYPDNPNPPDYWLWQVGLPMPTHSVAAVQAVGARRDCNFSKHHAFEERIVELEPNRKLVFVITKQPQHPEIIGHITVDKGQILLTPNPDGTTTITATSWYRLHVRPAAYFDWWAADVTRHIHFRVLGYMKHLAERDLLAAKGKST